jgi:hypothetical protein
LSNDTQQPRAMSTTYDKDEHSRASSQTNVPDLEKGETISERKNEEEVVSEVQVGAYNYVLWSDN